MLSGPVNCCSWGFTRFKTREFWGPRYYSDILCAILLFIYVIPVIVWDVLFIVAAVHKPIGIGYFIYIVGLFYISCNTLINFSNAMRIDCSVFSNIVREIAIHSDWKDCRKCAQVMPPRSDHCSICNCCILKRVYHSGFIANCVGLENHRYYFLFIVYRFISSIVSLCYNLYYFTCLTANPEPQEFFIFELIPVIVKDKSKLDVVIAFINFICLINFGYLLKMNILMLYYGFIPQDRNRNQYNMGWRKNVRTVLGRRMYSVWLWPCIKSELITEGFSWQEEIQLRDSYI